MDKNHNKLEFKFKNHKINGTRVYQLMWFESYEFCSLPELYMLAPEHVCQIGPSKTIILEQAGSKSVTTEKTLLVAPQINEDWQTRQKLEFPRLSRDKITGMTVIRTGAFLTGSEVVELLNIAEKAGENLYVIRNASKSPKNIHEVRQYASTMKIGDTWSTSI
jgi:hypothetical protein